MREEFVEIAAENLRLRGEAAEKDGRLDAERRRVADLDAEREGRRAVHAARIRAMEATHAAEIAELVERIGMLEADKAALAGENKMLSASDAYHNNPHSPPRSGMWIAEYRRRKAAERLRARRTDWRPPGKAAGHPGATRRIEPNRPDEHRHPFECHKGRGRNLSEIHAFAKQVVEIERVDVSRRNVVMHVMECGDCGAVVDAPRGGTLKKTRVGPRAAAARAAAGGAASAAGTYTARRTTAGT